MQQQAAVDQRLGTAQQLGMAQKEASPQPRRCSKLTELMTWIAAWIDPDWFIALSAFA